MPNFRKDRQTAALWAHTMLQSEDWCVLDTETTGLDNDAQICQISAVTPLGNPLINTLVRPTIEIPSDAIQIHGITNERVMGAPDFPEIFMQLWQMVGDRQIVIYNAPFDLRMIYQSLKAWGYRLRLEGCDRLVAGSYADGAPRIMRWTYNWINGQAVHCAMDWFSQWCGEWSNYHGNYRWQRLPGGDHSALGDCKATLEVIRRMAASYQPEPEPQSEPVEPKGARLVEMPQVAAGAEQYDDIPF